MWIRTRTKLLNLAYASTIVKRSEGGSGNSLVYLEVWQRHVSSLEDAEITESPIGGPDTSPRRYLLFCGRELQAEQVMRSIHQAIEDGVRILDLRVYPDRKCTVIRKLHGPIG